MNKQEEILKKYKEFADFVASINIEQMKKESSRKEILDFQECLKQIKIPSLSLQLSQVVKEMKEEEFPQLKGVHHYPELEEIDFMSEKQKIELDNHLMMIRTGQYVFNLFRYVKDTSRLVEFLLQKGIVEKRYTLLCPHHYDERIKVGMSAEELATIKEAIQRQDYEVLSAFYDDFNYCESCQDTVEYLSWNDRLVKEDFVKVKERDNSLDTL